MYPVYRYMDSYPQTGHPHRYQASYPEHFHPSGEPPFNGIARYVNSGECNGCWNHAHPPAPFIPCPHPQLPQQYFHGAYPPCPNMYAPYFIPPPQYLADQGRSHCCGCPNHSCQRKDDHSLKIEEEKSGIETKDNGSSGMTQWQAYPYPLLLFPPEQMKDNDQETNKLKDNGSSFLIKQPTYPYPQFWFPPDHMRYNKHKSSEPQQHGPFDKGIPLDLNSLKSSRENEEKKIDNQQNGVKRMQFPLPIIWMPTHDQSQEAEENVKDAKASIRAAEDLPAKFKIIPVNDVENDNHKEKPQLLDVNPGNQIFLTLPDKGSGPKNIPVKYMEESEPKKVQQPEKQAGYGAEKSSADEMQEDKLQEKRTSDNGTEKQMSPGRSFKLPPVCLRVDPLPRKKTGNGSSRSPSPRGNKLLKDDQDGKVRETGVSGDLKESKEDATMDKEFRVVEVDTQHSEFQKGGSKGMNRVVEIEDGSTIKKEGEDKNQDKLDVPSAENHSGMGIELVERRGKSEDMAKGMENGIHTNLKNNGVANLGHSESKVDDNKNTIEASDGKKMEKNKGGRGKFSETDAALCIQSAYRGYEVRRWQPLKKLKQIARIRDQVSSIKQQIQSLGQLDEKQKLFIGENIMSLLLQLDTIQGLHPSVREIRKSVANDLVSLQEKLDTMSTKVAEELVHIEGGDAVKVGDTKTGVEGVKCDNTSDLIESISLREEPARPSIADTLDHSAADKQEGVGFQQDSSTELLPEDGVHQNSTPNNQQVLPEIRDEQLPNSESVRPDFGTEVPCCREIGECTKPQTAHEAEVDSIVFNVSDLLKRDECSLLQQGVCDGETVEEEGSAVADIFVGEDDEAEPESKEPHKMQVKQIEQPAVSMQPLRLGDPAVPQEAVQAEGQVPAIEDRMNAHEHEPMPISECSESLQQFEVSASGTKASMFQSGEHGPKQGDHLDEALEGYCSEAGAAGSTYRPCSESAVLGVDVKENGGIGNEVKHEFEELQRFESINPKVAAIEDDVEHPTVENWDVSAPVPRIGVHLAEDDNNQKPPALTVEESISEEEERSSEISDEKLVSYTIVGLETKDSETERTSVEDVERERKLLEENEKLKEMLEKLLEVGNKQLGMISSLSGRVKDLEKKVARRRRRLRVKQNRVSKGSPHNNLAVESPV